MKIGNNDISKIYVGSTEITKVYVGSVLAYSASTSGGPITAVIGDIVVYSVSDAELRFIPADDYNTTSYPTANYVPVGIVCENQSGSSVCMIAKERIPNKNSNWGAWGLAEDILDTAGLDYYTDNIEVAKTRDLGRAITAALVSGNTYPEDFENHTGDINYANFPESGQMTAAITAYMYVTSGTAKGEWFVPSPYDLRQIAATEWATINASINKISGAHQLLAAQTCILTKNTYNPSVYYITGGTWSTMLPWYSSYAPIRPVYRGEIKDINYIDPNEENHLTRLNLTPQNNEISTYCNSENRTTIYQGMALPSP